MHDAAASSVARLKFVETIGVIGGGQLGRMFALDAKRMGYHVITLDPQELSPCGQVADEQIVAAYDDLAAIEELGRRSDVVTYEFENIDIASVRHLETLGHRVTPASGVLRVTQDRLAEKQFARECRHRDDGFCAGARRLRSRRRGARDRLPGRHQDRARRIRRQGPMARRVARGGARCAR